jgi:beta-phosphoglucomutase
MTKAGGDGGCMAIRAIVFDFDGVLADSESLHLKAYQAILEPHGIHLDMKTYCERYLGFDDEGSIRQVVADYNLMLADEEIEVLLKQKARIFEKFVAKGDVLFPGAAACVKRLGAAWPLGIASGALRGEIELMLRGASLASAFRFIVAAGDTDLTKPAPDPYLRAAEMHGVPPAECAAIEDSHWGLQSAREAGMRTIAVSHTYPRSSLTDAHLVVDSLDELTVAAIQAL